MGNTQSQSVSTVLQRITMRSNLNPQMRFTHLMGHVNEHTLKEVFYELNRRASPGADRVTWYEYEANLDKNVAQLIVAMKNFSYRASPVREVLIPKAGEKDAKRPLGICTIEDRMVQKLMAKLIEAVFEPHFLGCSYGFRPKRGCIDAVRGVMTKMSNTPTSTVLDIDIKNYFGSIPQDKLLECLRMRITDKVLLRYVARAIKAGILSKDGFRVSDEGVPQGSPLSPILSNIYAHYVIDVWVDRVVNPLCRRSVSVFRYADDFLILCQSKSDATLVLARIKDRVEKCGLTVSERKTKVVPFSKHRASKGEKQGTFSFLGFEFYIGRSRNGRYIHRVKTDGKRLGHKLKTVSEWCRKNRHSARLLKLWNRFRMKLAGHINYYSVSFNIDWVGKFRDQAIKTFFKWMNRRSQRKSFTWEKFGLFLKAYPPPKVRIVHRLF